MTRAGGRVSDRYAVFLSYSRNDLGPRVRERHPRNYCAGAG
jgi:hypothetical protein